MIADLAATIAASGMDLEAWFASSSARYGVPPQLYRMHGIVCATRGYLDAPTWQPSPDGRRLWCIPVRSIGMPAAGAPQHVVAHGEMVDAIAFDPRRPEAWGLALGVATWLGCAPRQDIMPDPVPIHRDPLGWLRSRCDGLVLLGRDPLCAQTVLREMRHILAEDAEHRRELRVIAERPQGGPMISVRARAA
jgi:hypothetical protein